MRTFTSSAKRTCPASASLLLTMGGATLMPAASLVFALLMAGSSMPVKAATPTVTTAVGTVEISPAPPNVTRSVPPNIVLTFDDSGSMAQTNVPDSLSTSYKYYYSSNSNPVYFNPKNTYVPPLKPDGVTRFPNSTYTNAWRDGICANISSNSNCKGTVDLSKSFKTGTVYSTLSASPKQAYESLSDIPSTLGQKNPKDTTPSGGFYYDCPTVNSETGCVLKTIGTDATQRQNFANWFSYYRTRMELTRSAMSETFAQLGTDIRVAYQFLNAGDLVKGGTTRYKKFEDSSTGVGARSDFFKWLYSAYANGSTPTRNAIEAVGAALSYGANKSGPNVSDNTNPYWEDGVGVDNSGMELTCRQNFSVLVTDGYWNTGAPKSLAFSPKQATELPDGTEYDPTSIDSKIFWNVGGGNSDITLSNIAFSYWAKNLRPDFTNPADSSKPKLDVPTLITDFTDANGKTVAWDGQGIPPPAIYFNPKNDPASWPHVVQYMVTLGVSGSLPYPDSYSALRAGTEKWPKPSDSSQGDNTDIDDTWHAAINSRGAYLEANDPPSLVARLNSILTNIASRNSPQSTSALNTGVIADGALSFLTGYSSSDWSGTFRAATVGANGTLGNSGGWDAGLLLTQRTTARTILTSKEKTDGSFGGGTTFAWSNLDGKAQTLLATLPASSGGSDTGEARLAWLAGTTTNDGTLYRKRSTLLGAVINSQAVFVSYPNANYRDSWPAGSPEAEAIASDKSTCATDDPPTCSGYEYFVKNHADRRPAVYIGANDGMLHAFDASMTTNSSPPPDVIPSGTAGTELFAYVPRSAYANLGSVTSRDISKFMPTVDGTPVVRDVFFAADSALPVSTSKGWHTILVGGLRLGGRGIYALDVTDPTAMTSDKVLWEFNAESPKPVGTDCVASFGSCDPADLGFTFGQPNIGRLANGKWVVLVPGGYFPDCTKAPFSATNCPTPGGSPTSGSPAVAFSSLFVLDAQTGAMIAELKTPTSIKDVSSFGLSSPVLGDYNDDQVDDVAFAGDLNGNLWRFDLTSTKPEEWKVTLAYKPDVPGNQPITTMPRLFPDPATNRFIVVFGTGKYLGASDSANNIVQSIYGIRDLVSSDDPAVRSDLQKQTLYEAGSGNGINIVRGLTDNAVSASQKGWYIDLDLENSLGERVVVTPAALFDTNRAVITTLIPGAQDPCSATVNGALMVLDAATGGAGDDLASPARPTSWGGGVSGSSVKVVGGRVINPPTGGSLPIATLVGGGSLLAPGLQLQGGGGLNINDAVWRRRSWRSISNQ